MAFRFFRKLLQFESTQRSMLRFDGDFLNWRYPKMDSCWENAYFRKPPDGVEVEFSDWVVLGLPRCPTFPLSLRCLKLCSSSAPHSVFLQAAGAKGASQWVWYGLEWCGLPSDIYIYIYIHTHVYMYIHICLYIYIYT